MFISSPLPPYDSPVSPPATCCRAEEAEIPARLFVADFDGIKLLLTSNIYYLTRYRLMILVALTTFPMWQVRMLIRSLGLIREFRDVDGEEI